MQQALLAHGEKGRLQIINNHGVVAKQFRGLGGEAGFQFLGITGIEPHQHGFVVEFSILIFVAKTSEERVAVFPGPALKRELRLLLGQANESHQIHLFIGGQGAAEKLVLPIGPPRNI